MNKIALLFSGQGAQYVGMGKFLCDRYNIAKELFENASSILNFDLMKLCFEGNITELTKTENAQPAILTTSVAAYYAYMEQFGIEPRYLAGNSLGEISALTCSGAISFEDAVNIAHTRGKLMQSAVAMGEGSMAAISKISKDVVEEECRKVSSEGNIVVISNYNTQEQFTISGHTAAVSEVSNKLKQIGADVIPLKVSAPFHSPLMQVAANKFAIELQKYNFNNIKYPVISNVTALPYDNKENIIELLPAQIVQPVQWQKSMNYLQMQGVDIAIELGVKNTLKNMMKKIAPKVNSYSFDKQEDVAELISKLNINDPVKDIKSQKLKLITKCLAITVCTKNNNWDSDEYEKGVVEPYKKISNMLEQLEKEGKEPSVVQLEEALEMLKMVFDTKKTDIEEQIYRFNEIFNEAGIKDLIPNFKIPC